MLYLKYNNFLNEGKYTSLIKYTVKEFCSLIKNNKEDNIIQKVYKLDENEIRFLYIRTNIKFLKNNLNKYEDYYDVDNYTYEEIEKDFKKDNIFFLLSDVQRFVNKVYYNRITVFVLFNKDEDEKQYYHEIYKTLLALYTHEYNHLNQYTTKLGKEVGFNIDAMEELKNNAKHYTFDEVKYIVKKYMNDQSSFPYEVRKIEIDSYIKQFYVTAKMNRRPISDYLDSYINKIITLNLKEDIEEIVLKYFFFNLFSHFNKIQLRKDFVEKYKKYFGVKIKENKNYKLI